MYKLILKIEKILNKLNELGMYNIYESINKEYLLICQKGFGYVFKNDTCQRDELVSLYLCQCKKILIKSCLDLQKRILNNVFGLYNKNLNKKRLEIRDKLIIFAFKHGNNPDLYNSFKNARNYYVQTKKKSSDLSDLEINDLYDKSIDLVALYNSCFSNKILP